MNLQQERIPRLRRMIGAGPGIISPGDDYVIVLDASQGGASYIPQALPAELYGVSISAPDSSGKVKVSGYYSKLQGQGLPYQVETSYSFTLQGQGVPPTSKTFTFPVVSVTSIPPGIVKKQIPVNVGIPMPKKPSPILLSAITGGIGGTGTGTQAGSPFPLPQGHRISATTTLQGGGVLPADFQGQTVPSLQKEIDAAGIKVTIVSVEYDVPSPKATMLTVVEDHCGPTTTASSPYTVSDGGVNVQTIYADQTVAMGIKASCPAPAPPLAQSSGMSTKTKVALSAFGLAALGVGAWGAHKAGWY